MPGTIHVSVLKFKDLPSSLTSSSILIKVSMGTREHQTRGKGEFSFPLTTLRDSMTIDIQDTEGNEILHKGVQTMSVVEKGSWDEFLPLEGGGLVHMKWQFVLTEEEHLRIRSMRESAMKKRGELRTGSPICKTASIFDSHVLGIKREISAVSIGDLAIHGTPSNPESAGGNKEGTAMHQKQISPSDVDGSESKKIDVHISDIKHSKSAEDTESMLCREVPQKPISLQEVSSAMKKNFVASKLNNVQAYELEKQDPLEKAPNNVSKMISAFEGSLSKDTRPSVKPAPAKPQSNKGEQEAYKDLNLKELPKPAKLRSGRIKNPFITGESPQCQTPEMKLEEHIGFHKPSQDTGKLKEPRSLQIQEIESAVKHEWRKPQEDLLRISAVEAATSSGSKHKELSGLLQTRNVLINHQGSSGPAGLEGPLEDKLKPVAFREHSSSTGAWIFPDHAWHFCMTTGSKKVMDLVGGCRIQEQTHMGCDSSSLTENVEKVGNCIGAKKGYKTSHELRKSRLECSAEVEASTGPVGQAIKVAIMVAFGTLVLLTRERRPR